MGSVKVLLDRLKKGEKVICPKCKKAVLQPFGTTYDKAHSFSCPECEMEVHYTPAIDIE